MNTAAVDELLRQPVQHHMIRHLAQQASSVVRGGEVPSAVVPSVVDHSQPRLPSLELFIQSLMRRSSIQVPTLLTTLIYLARLRAHLPPVATYTRCAGHRIFLAALIVAAKSLNDTSLKNIHWAEYTAVTGYPGFAFSLPDVNLMERQFLALLDWDIGVSEDAPFEHWEPFLAPIRRRKEVRHECVAFEEWERHAEQSTDDIYHVFLEPTDERFGEGPRIWRIGLDTDHTQSAQINN